MLVNAMWKDKELFKILALKVVIVGKGSARVLNPLRTFFTLLNCTNV